MDGGPLHLAAVGGVSAAAVGVVLAQDLDDVACLVLDAAGAMDQIGPLQAALGAAGIETLIFGYRGLQKVLRLDIQVAGESDGPGAILGAAGVVFHLEGLAVPLGVVGDGEPDGPQHRHHPLGGLVQILPQAVLQKGELHGGGGLAHAVALGEVPDGPGGIAPTAQTAQGGHPGVVPAGDLALLHELAQLALGHDGVVDAQPGKLDLPGLGGHRAVGDNPVVEGPVILELQGAQGVGDALQGVLNGVGEVVHGVDAPLVPLPVVVHVVDAVEDRVPHVEVAGGQVDLGPQGVPAVGELPGLHPGEQV